MEGDSKVLSQGLFVCMRREVQGSSSSRACSILKLKVKGKRNSNEISENILDLLKEISCHNQVTDW